MSGFDSASTKRRGDSTTPIVARSEELDCLRQWLAEALAGSPRVVVVTGDAGIGKSRLVAEFVREAREAGVRPFAGRCIEDSQLPLLPLATVIETLVGGTHAYRSEAARLSPDPDYRLAVAVDTSRALMSSAADRPALLVLEDAQWADQATIELVAHLVATLAHEAVFRQLPVMLLATARPNAPRNARRLLARLGQEAIGRTLHLPGLDDLGVFALLAALTGRQPSPSLVSFARDATAGNALEIESLVARLERAGALHVRDGEVVTTVEEMSALPIDADAELAARLQTVSGSTRQLLTTLALLRDGRLAVLRVASGLAPDDFESAVDAAVDRGLLVDEDARVSFADSGVERALARSTGRRRRGMHAEIARRLMADDATRAGAVSAIADQLHRSGPDVDPTVLATYARPAGDEALTLGAWTDALRHYEAVLRDPELDDAERAAVELRAAIAANRNHEPTAAARHATTAVELGRRIRDLRTWGKALLLRSRAAYVSAADAGRFVDPQDLRDFLEVAGDGEPELRAQVHAALSELDFTRFRFDAARSHADAAEDVAKEIDDDSAVARVEFAVGLQLLARLDLDAASERFRRCEEHARRAADALVAAWPIGRGCLVLWIQGRLEEAAATATRAAHHDREHGLWGECSFVAAARTGIAVARGNLSAAERIADEGAVLQRRASQFGIGPMLWSALASARALRGDVLGANVALDEWEREDPRPVAMYRRLADALSGRGDLPDAQESVTVVPADAPVNLATLSLAAANVELADALDRPELASGASRVLSEAYARGVRFLPGWCAFVPRLAGVACRLADRHDEAEEWLGRAVADARAAGAQGEIARSSYDLARVRVAAKGALDDAGELLDTAVEDLERLGYRPLAAAARRLAGRPDAHEATDAATLRVIMVTDLVGATPLARRVGDRRFVELLREHNRIVRTRLRQYDGVEFKHTGDGIASWFLTAGAAVECGLRIREDLERSNVGRPDDPLSVRIGISVGAVVSEGTDMFGLAVNTAFRVCDQATDGRILVSQDVPPLVRDAPFGFASVGEVVLKGFADPQQLFAVTTPGG